MYLHWEPKLGTKTEYTFHHADSFSTCDKEAAVPCPVMIVTAIIASSTTPVMSSFQNTILGLLQWFNIPLPYVLLIHAMDVNCDVYN